MNYNLQDYFLPSDNENGIYTAKKAKKDLDYLNNKLNKMTRKLSQWDLYKITDVLTSEENFQILTNSILPNTAFIIDCPSFIKNDILYNRGDLIFKTSDNNISHIKADRGGIFYPSTIKSLGNNNNYNISFSYLKQEPLQGTVKIIQKAGEWKVPDQQVKSTINFENLTSTTPSNIYGIVKDLGNPHENFYSFSLIDKIEPVIKGFTDSREEVIINWEFVDNTVGNTTTRTINNIPVLIKYVVIK